jgi:transmembrane protein TMEM260 (protein O-mannosyltransferase)
MSDGRSAGPGSMREPMSRATIAVPVATAAVAMSVYAATAARSITWWDGSSYPLAAATLGIPGAPGSLLLTLLGWVVCQIPVIHPVAFRLSLFAGLVIAALVGVVTGLGIRLATPEGHPATGRESFAGALAGLWFAFSVTPWTYAGQFTPYGLSALFTGLILVALLAWWRRPEGASGRPQLFLIFLLFGLDVSVHRTNSLLFPAGLLWLALRHPGGPPRPRDGLVSALGLALGLAFHLLLIPLAGRKPPYMAENPGDLAGWWSYVSLEIKGGGFLVNLFPRAADFFRFQLADLIAFYVRNFAPAFFLPAILAVVGWLVAVRDHPRRAFGWLGLFLCAGVGAVIYFNLPKGYMRSMDRHYLPSLVVMAPWVAVGAAALLRAAGRLREGRWLAPALAVALAIAPLAAWSVNRRLCDLSRLRFAEGFARDLLEPLPEHAVLLTNGDNDTFPLWYMQQIEGVRPDVAVVNLPLANSAEFVAGLRRRDPDFARLLEGEPERGVLPPKTVGDSTVTTMVEPRTGLGLPPGVAPPDSVTFHVKGMLLAQDRAVLDILRLTRWRRPVFLAVTVAPGQLEWLLPYTRLDGIARRVIPSDDPAVWDLDHLREVLIERMGYIAFADTTVAMDNDTRMLSSNYAGALFQLASAQAQRGQIREAKATVEFLERRLPVAKLGQAAEQVARFRAQLEAAAGRAGSGE